MDGVSRAKPARDGRRPSTGRKPVPREKRDTPFVGDACRKHYFRKISQAATTIRPNPAQWFHFSGSPR
jgi:hypothetical protein